MPYIVTSTSDISILIHWSASDHFHSNDTGHEQKGVRIISTIHWRSSAHLRPMAFNRHRWPMCATQVVRFSTHFVYYVCGRSWCAVCTCTRCSANVCECLFSPMRTANGRIGKRTQHYTLCAAIIVRCSACFARTVRYRARHNQLYWTLCSIDNRSVYLKFFFNPAPDALF